MPSIAENWFPSLERSVISSAPVSQHRRDSETRLDGESERSLVLKPNIHRTILRGKRQFHVSNDFTFGLGEPENFPYSAGAGSFIVSHVASRKGDFGQGCVRAQTRMRPVAVIPRLPSDSGMKSKLGHHQELLSVASL